MDLLKNSHRTPNPRKNSNFLSRYFFRYLNSTLATGFKRPLAKADIFKILEQDSCEVLTSKLRKKWLEEKSYCRKKEKTPSLFKAVLKMAAFRIIIITLLMLILGLLKISQAMLLQILLKEVAEPNFWEKNDVYYWGTGLSGAIIVTWIFIHHTFLLSDVLGANMKSAVLGLMYKKTLKLGDSVLNGISTGHVITLFSTDAQKIQEIFRLVYFMAIAPVLLIVSTYLLWIELGPSCLAGVGVMVLIIPLQAIAGRFFGYMRIKTVEKTDQRMNLMNEIILSMRITKMFTWEDSFAKLVKDIRKSESSKIMSVQLMRAFNNAMYGCSPYIVGLATFVTFYIHGTNNLSVSLVAGTMSIFFAIRMEVTYFFSLAIQSFFEGKASCKRIQKFLLLCEVDCLNNSTHSKRTSSLTFDHVFASWSIGEKVSVVNDVSFNANLKNNLVMIVGPVGTGKTSLLMTVLDELIIQRGKIQRIGRLAYSAQLPWMFSGTIRQNIVFGKEFKKGFYEKVVTACALAPDFAELERGDLTVVGERGVSLSGGQKARISLARALYQDADIYLLDNPLSTVDAKVGKHIFESCIQGLLKKKITILVTHQMQYLEHATSIVCLQKDTCSVEGTFEELTNRGINLVTLLRSEPDDKFSDVDSAIETEDYLQYHHADSQKRPALDLTGISLNNKRLDALDAEARSSMRSLHSQLCEDDNNNANVDDGETERTAKGSISPTIYLRYFVNGVGWLAAILLFVGIIVGQVLMTLSDVWLNEWALGEEQKTANQTITAKFYNTDNRKMNLYVFIILVCLAFIGNVSRLMFLFAAMVKCSRRLHNKMFEAILKAPMYFFDKNPTGQILNRFSKDIYLLDEELPWTFNDMIQLFFLTMAIVVLNCISVPYLLIVLIPILILFLLLRFYFLRSSRQLRRLEAVCRSPFYTHLSSTLSGLPTIRSFEMKNHLLKEFFACTDYQVEGWLMYIHAMKWFGLRLDIIASLFSICSIFAPLVLARFIAIDEGLVGVSLTYVLLLSGMFNWCVSQSTEVDNLMTSVERVYEYADLEPELEEGENKGLRETWPEYGLLTCESVSFSYHPSLPYVLRRLFFCVRPYEKIGIVGRTGSGKSSIINMLFRMGNMNGTIRIDGFPIDQLKLKDLRKAISVIPQDPVLFSGTIRRNLDPFSKFLDGDIWEVLEEVQMNEAVLGYKHKLDTEITESGSNLSIGQRQLLCLARALLQKNKILLIDEATSNIDFETDTLIQRTIREKFKDCTVITIAHRLNTIMDSDRIMVLEGGKQVEFDEPSVLLENPDGYFRNLVDQAGRNEANRLEALAEESKHLRHLMLLQTQVANPGAHITVSKTKAELISYFGQQVIYETNV